MLTGNQRSETESGSASAPRGARDGGTTMRRPLFSALPILLLLGGCDMVVLSPSGYVAAQQRDLLVSSTLLMLVIIIPVMGLTAFFAWRYSAARQSRYDPEWHHSTSLELVIWAAPLMIIICLGAITWVGTHLLDPFRPLERIGERRPVPPGIEPLEVAGGGARLEVAVHLSAIRHRHGQRRRGAGRPADPLPPDRVGGDERLLRAGARRA